ncbi:MAG: aspartyl protease family protein [Verrucomicrobia bacterium]|nr:aspartyl protease family protein [Verrucomicrobiota bacterium]
MALLLTFAVLPLRAEEQQSLSPLRSGALRKSGMPATAESVTIPLNSTLSGFTVEVRINGNPVDLVLDTGAALTILSPETARKLGLKAEGIGDQVRGITGMHLEAQRVLTRRFSLGEAWTENEPVGVLPMPQGLNGILGVATLADWDVRIDPATKELTLFPANKARPLEGEIALPLTCELVNPEASKSNPQGLRLLNLMVPVRVGSHDFLAVPDTGNGGILTLPRALMDKIAPEAMKEAWPALVSGVSISGSMATRAAKLPEFTFGPDTLRGLATDVYDAVPGTRGERMGSIGLNLLRHYVMTCRFSAGDLRLKPLGTVQEITRTSTAGMNLGFGDGGRILILSVVPEGPAASAGLRAEDSILEIEGRPLKTMKPEELAAFKRLPPGSSVKVLYRRGEAKPVEVTLVLVKQ